MPTHVHSFDVAGLVEVDSADALSGDRPAVSVGITADLGSRQFDPVTVAARFDAIHLIQAIAEQAGLEVVIDPMTTAEVAREIFMSASGLKSRRSRGDLDLPEPAGVWSRVPVWEAHVIRHWATTHHEKDATEG